MTCVADFAGMPDYLKQELTEAGTLPQSRFVQFFDSYQGRFFRHYVDIVVVPWGDPRIDEIIEVWCQALVEAGQGFVSPATALARHPLLIESPSWVLSCWAQKKTDCRRMEGMIIPWQANLAGLMRLESSIDHLVEIPEHYFSIETEYYHLLPKLDVPHRIKRRLSLFQ